MAASDSLSLSRRCRSVPTSGVVDGAVQPPDAIGRRQADLVGVDHTTARGLARSPYPKLVEQHQPERVVLVVSGAGGEGDRDLRVVER